MVFLLEKDKQAIKCALDLMEKEILYFTGRKRALTRRKYLRYLKMCGKQCSIGESIFIDRS